MQFNIILKEEIFKKLQDKSEKIGINPEELANDLLEESLNSTPKMVRLADSFEELIGICDYPESTNANELKQLSRERRL